jgi:hypothetical protein
MEKICKIDGCGCCVRNKDLCNKHYLRLLRHGDPLYQKRKSPGTATDEDKKRWKREEYQRNKSKYIARAAKWADQNQEKVRAYFEREENKEKSRKRTKEWAAQNKDKKRSYDREWVKNNRAVSNSHKAKRRAKERSATPNWLTKEQIDAIKAIYSEAERLTQETGIRHEVDHIVPLAGKTVSGLHVPWNLRAIPATENNRRPRIWDHNTQI